MDKSGARGAQALLICMAALSLSGCGGGGGSGTTVSSRASPPCTACSVSGTVSGLNAGESVTLLNNGGDELIVTSDGAFTFSTREAASGAYDVTVQSHTPGIACSVSNGSGVVGTSNEANIAVSCATGMETVVHSFAGDSADGQYPAGLIMDGAGDLYGVTAGGGAYASGTVFRLSAAGQMSILYSFRGGTTDGSNPLAGLAMDSAGNLYGTTTGGGSSSGDGTVFEISPMGTETIPHFFTGGPTDGTIPWGGLAADSAGNLYGTTFAGGAYGLGAVFKISSSGTETILHSFAGGTVDGSNLGQVPGMPLLVDGSGSVYGVTGGGGAYGSGTVFRIDPAGTETVLYSFGGGTTDGTAPQSLISDGVGNLYGTTAGGGAYGLGTVFEIK